MSLYKQKGSKNWWAKVSYHGRQVRRSTGTDARGAAEKEELKIKLAMMEADTTRAREGTGTAEEFASNILEHLQAIRARHDGIARELTTGILSLESHRALVHGNIAALNARMDNFSKRLDRIEQRLDLTDGS